MISLGELNENEYLIKIYAHRKNNPIQKLGSKAVHLKKKNFFPQTINKKIKAAFSENKIY